MPIRLLVEYSNYSDKSIVEVILNYIILGKDNGHLWFLTALFLIFIIYFILEKNKLLLKSDFLFFVILIPISIIGGHIFPLFLGSAFSNLMWFGLGDLIRKKKSLLLKYKKAFLCSLLFIMIASIFYLMLYLNNDYKYVCFIMKIGICLLLIPLLYLVSPHSTTSVVSMIDKNSFGIYLFHSPLIYITYAYCSELQPIFIFFINFIVFGSVSFFLTNIIRLLKMNIIIGEKYNKKNV